MIKRAERDTPVPHLQMSGLATIKKALEKEGVVFLPDDDVNFCAVALRKGTKAPKSD
ncbi:hypothetical protein GRZ55_22745 [Chelativorans sp. ZYF759]|uniref:hypothetical protein n=1 Tax=Chelativorans sp. ZYF759 TaxID=2692213 RepID=UPI00145EF1A2|nr:hypothetical protein [Chelativorans sp. ZYF759]NMG42043.1 hypothetical protein [Chelativorans sp. ZYF759]